MVASKNEHLWWFRRLHFFSNFFYIYIYLVGYVGQVKTYTNPIYMLCMMHDFTIWLESIVGSNCWMLTTVGKSMITKWFFLKAKLIVNFAKDDLDWFFLTSLGCSLLTHRFLLLFFVFIFIDGGFSKVTVHFFPIEIR